MQFTKEQLNPFNKPPEFKTVKEEIAWIKIMIDKCSNYPSQGMQLYAASLIFRLDELEKV